MSDLTLTKTVSDPNPNVGDVVEFTIVITNAGPDAATTVAAVDDLLVGLTLLSAVATNGTYNPDNGVWDINNLPAGGDATLRIDARVDTSDPIANIATIVASDSFDPDPTDDGDAVVLTPREADLRLAKTVATPTVSAGSTATFTVTVTNSGPDSATAVTVTDALPAGLVYESHVASTGAHSMVRPIHRRPTPTPSPVTTCPARTTRTTRR